MSTDAAHAFHTAGFDAFVHGRGQELVRVDGGADMAITAVRTDSDDQVCVRFTYELKPGH